MKKILIVSALSVVLPYGAFAFASDNAADSAYNSGWVTGTNGGTGFGAWSVTPYTFGSASADTYMATNSFVDIKTGGRAWGISNSVDDYSYSGVEALRDISTPLAKYDKFSIDIDNGIQVDPNFGGAGWGVSLQNASGQEMTGIFNYTTVPGRNWAIQGGSDIMIGLIQHGGFHLTFTVTGANTFDVTMEPLSGGSNTFSGVFKNAGQISKVRIWSYNLGAAADGSQDNYFNNMKVVPEPGSIFAIGAGLGAIILRRSRKA